MRIIISILILLSINTNAQSSHIPITDTTKAKYYDLQGRPVQPGFFQEVNMGFCSWFILDDGVRRRKVWIDTRKNK
tara:strand:- start:158 stop:385 length:228 start_codon:yes stop_codon:yes gene_type:complete